MHHRTMPNMGVFLQKDRSAREHVKYTPLLHIDTALQYDFPPIPSQHGMGAHITVFSHRDVPDEGGLGMHKSTGVHHGHHVPKGINHDADALRITTA